MQSQVPLDPYVGLWSRLRVFDPEAFGRRLLERRLVRMTFIRATLHLVSREDALRFRPLLQDLLERSFASSPFARELAGLDLAAVVARGVELVEQSPLTIAQLAGALAEEWSEHDANSLAYAVRYLVPLVQVTPRGVWGASLRPAVTTLACWLGEEDAVAASADELVLRYLRAFGPASVADIRAWSGLRDVGAVAGRLRPSLRVYRDEAGRELLDVPEGELADGSLRAPVRFLPQYDNVFLAHADRGRIMQAVRWDGSFTHRGTFLVDGFIAGSWKLSETRHDATLQVEPRTRLAAASRRQLEDEAEALLAFRTPAARSRQLVFAE